MSEAVAVDMAVCVSGSPSRRSNSTTRALETEELAIDRMHQGERQLPESQLVDALVESMAQVAARLRARFASICMSRSLHLLNRLQQIKIENTERRRRSVKGVESCVCRSEV